MAATPLPLTASPGPEIVLKRLRFPSANSVFCKEKPHGFDVKKKGKKKVLAFISSFTAEENGFIFVSVRFFYAGISVLGE